MTILIFLLFFVFQVHCERKFPPPCKILETTKYSYKDLYEVDYSNLTLSDDVKFELHFSIKAESNGHVVLSPVKNIEVNTPVYEFVIGGGSNTFSQLRHNTLKNSKMDKITHNILSADEFRDFWIRIKTDGLIEFGKEGDDTPILFYKDPNPIIVKYFGFASWMNVYAKYVFNCPDQIGKNRSQTIVDPKPKSMSPLERLHADIIKNHTDVKSPPYVPSLVGLSIVATSLKYDAIESKLDTTLGIIMTWQTNIKWVPYEYDMNMVAYMEDDQIWTPNLYVLNSDDEGLIDLDVSYPVGVLFLGTAATKLTTKKKAWCDNVDVTYSKWPRDEYNCSMYFASWDVPTTFSKLYAVSFTSTDILTPMVTHDWDLLNTTEVYLAWNNSMFHKQFAEDVRFLMFPGLSTGSLVKFTFHIRRKNGAFLILYTPLLTIIYFLIFTFYTDPLSERRLWYYLAIVLTTCAMLSYLEMIIPGHTLPFIMILYITVLFATLFALVVNLILKHKSIVKIGKTGRIIEFLALPAVRFLFQVNAVKLPETYESHTGTDAEEPEYSETQDSIENSRNFERFEESELNMREVRRDFIQVVDTILFLVYFVMFTVLLATHY